MGCINFVICLVGHFGNRWKTLRKYLTKSTVDLLFIIFTNKPLLYQIAHTCEKSLEDCPMLSLQTFHFASLHKLERNKLKFEMFTMARALTELIKIIVTVNILI